MVEPLDQLLQTPPIRRSTVAARIGVGVPAIAVKVIAYVVESKIRPLSASP